MIRDTNVILKYEAKRNPTLKTMLDYISDYSISEIEKAPFVKNIRLAMLRMKQQAGETEKIAYYSKFIVDGNMPDPIGEIRRWTGFDTFVQVDRGSSIQVSENGLIWFPATGGVWLQNLYSKTIDPRLITQTQSIGTASKSKYMEIYKQEWSKLIPTSDPIMVKPAFQIYRV